MSDYGKILYYGEILEENRPQDSQKNIRIWHECEVRMDKSVPRVTVWHREALSSDAKQIPEGQICPPVPNTNNRFVFLHIFLPTLELIKILL